jgi:S-formylglutathione hydrolase FrmB
MSIIMLCSLIAFLPLVGTTYGEQAAPRVQEITFYSSALQKSSVFTIVRPEEDCPPRGCPVLFVLHGLGRNHRTLIDNPDSLQLLLRQPYLIVLPDSAKGWWVDSKRTGNYDSMLLEVIEKVKRCEPVSQSRKDWAILGWSMGGFGAVHFAEGHPRQFGFVGTIIGLLDFPKLNGLPPGQTFPVNEQVFGNNPKDWNAQNPCTHVQALADDTVVLVIANQSFDRAMNEGFIRCATEAHVTPSVSRIDGKHVFSSVQKGLEILLPRVAQYFEEDVS